MVHDSSILIQTTQQRLVGVGRAYDLHKLVVIMVATD